MIPFQPLLFPVFDPFVILFGMDEKLHLHLFKFTRTKDEIARGDLVSKSLPYLSHPKFSLIDQGRFIKRRLASGEVQRTFEPPNRKSMPQGMPLNVESVSLCDPDSANVLPIVYGIVDPASPVALKTLESMEELWNQRWDGGGYGRYHVTSEPDSPGPWPFPTMFIARAYLETGNDEKVWRALRWLQEAPGGKAGAWLEFYGDRPTPPLPPVGIVVWTWAEILMFFIHHLLVEHRWCQKGFSQDEARQKANASELRLRQNSFS